MTTKHEGSAKSRLDKFLSEHPHYANKALGQNFLVNDLVIEKMIKALQSLEPQHVIEVGPGPGALTDHLLEMKNFKLTLIELDPHLASVWRERGAEIQEADALKFDWQQLKDLPEKVLISNLPYQISSSIVMDRSQDEVPFKGMILMFQKEVADRIRAKIRTVDYGLLSVMAQTFWDVELLAGLGRVDFIPPPQVNSQVLFFKSKTSTITAPLLTSPQLNTTLQKNKFLKLVKVAFQHRRKLMKSNLKASFDAAKIEKAFDELRLDPKVRAEEISPLQFQKLFEILGSNQTSRISKE